MCNYLGEKKILEIKNLKKKGKKDRKANNTPFNKSRNTSIDKICQRSKLFQPCKKTKAVNENTLEIPRKEILGSMI